MIGVLLRWGSSASTSTVVEPVEHWSMIGVLLRWGSSASTSTVFESLEHWWWIRGSQDCSFIVIVTWLHWCNDAFLSNDGWTLNMFIKLRSLLSNKVWRHSSITLVLFSTSIEARMDESLHHLSFCWIFDAVHGRSVGHHFCVGLAEILARRVQIHPLSAEFLFGNSKP